jgi:hypothetical protein
MATVRDAVSTPGKLIVEDLWSGQVNRGTLTVDLAIDKDIFLRGDDEAVELTVRLGGSTSDPTLADLVLERQDASRTLVAGMKSAPGKTSDGGVKYPIDRLVQQIAGAIF